MHPGGARFLRLRALGTQQGNFRQCPNLRRLGFNRTADDLNDLIAQAARKRSSATVLLEHIVAAELEDKQRRSVESRLTRARLGRFKPFADWD